MREFIENELKEAGRRAKNYIDNGRHEGWHVSHEEKVFKSLKTTYLAIKAGKDMVRELQTAKKAIGPCIEGNHLSLLIDALNGNLDSKYWRIKNNKLTFVGI